MKRRSMLRAALAGVFICATAALAAEGTMVKGNPNSKVYHNAQCRYYNAKGSTKEFASSAAAEQAGYKACKQCGKKKAKAEKKSEKKTEPKK